MSGCSKGSLNCALSQALLISICPIFDRSKTGPKNPRGGARCGWTATALGTTNQKGPKGHPGDSLLRRSDIDLYAVPALRFGPETPYRPRPRFNSRLGCHYDR
jgi:hypothetical protein